MNAHKSDICDAKRDGTEIKQFDVECYFWSKKITSSKKEKKRRGVTRGNFDTITIFLFFHHPNRALIMMFNMLKTSTIEQVLKLLTINSFGI